MSKLSRPRIKPDVGILGVHQKNKVVPAVKAAFHGAIRLPSEPSGPVPPDRARKTAGESEAYPIAVKTVFQNKKLRPPTADAPALAKNFLYIAHLFEVLIPGKPKGTLGPGQNRRQTETRP